LLENASLAWAKLGMGNTYVFGDIHGRARQLRDILEAVDYDERRDRVIFVGDLIDRGEESPEVVEYVLQLCRRNPKVVCLRGNHEQMLLDLIDYGDPLWLIPENGGIQTLQQYGFDIDEHTASLAIGIPESHLEFLRSLPFFYEDEKALYVHAGIPAGKHPAECDPEALMWTRDLNFFTLYNGKPCFFGHTPARLLPAEGVRNPGEIYVFGSAIGLDTGCTEEDCLSCLHVEAQVVYQKYPNLPVSTYEIEIPCLTGFSAQVFFHS
jgi:serine/threonine protein phosphatase 1